jgi:hypothetical protein
VEQALPRIWDFLTLREVAPQALGSAATRLRTSGIDLLPDPRGVVTALREKYADKPPPFIDSADRALQGRFDLLGLEDVSFGTPIDWRYEPLADRRTPLVHWKSLDNLEAGQTGDRKLVWEVNRHQHLPVLGQAFLWTGDERYAAGFAEQVSAWIDANPPRQGINWVSSLELSFRIISWIYALHFFRNSRHLTNELVTKTLGSLHAQAGHIAAYLSTYSSPNTHLTGEALGLYYLGTCLAELDDNGRWRALGRAILLAQVNRHVLPDGVYFEQSSWYQRYTADFYTHFLVLAERSGDSVPAGVRTRLEALLDHLMWLTRPDGTSPYIGDDDGGTLMKVERRAACDWRSTLSHGAAIFGRGDFKFVGGALSDETLWLLGAASKARFSATSGVSPALLSRAFHDGGYYVMRDGWTRESSYLLVDCGPHGTMNCGHAHADALSIELVARGTPMLVDPGTFTYTGSAELRDVFRSTAMHNTATVDGQPSSVPAGPFKWQHTARSRVLCWHDHVRFSYFAGLHDGYRRLADPVVHERSVLYIRGEYWLILDRCRARSTHDFALHFHFAPGVAVRLDPQAKRLAASTSDTSLDISFVGEPGVLSAGDDWVSPAYGRRVQAAVGAYGATALGDTSILSAMLPDTHGNPPGVVQVVDVELGKGRVISTAGRRDLLLWKAGIVPQEGIRAADFEWVWMRRPLNGTLATEVILLHGTRFDTDLGSFTFEQPVGFGVLSAQAGDLSLDVWPPVGIRARISAGCGGLVVNGHRCSPGPDGQIAVSRDQVPALGSPRDASDRCDHVRH